MSLSEHKEKFEEKKKETFAQIDQMIPRLIGESEKSPILVGVTAVENELEKLIQDYLIDSPTGIDDLFETGALSNFSSKISIARRIGLINNELQNAIDIMRKLRNSVSRSDFPDIYNSTQIKSLIDELINRYSEIPEFREIENSINMNDQFNLEKFNNENKATFIVLVSYLFYILVKARYTAETEDYRARLILSFP